MATLEKLTVVEMDSGLPIFIRISREFIAVFTTAAAGHRHYRDFRLSYGDCKMSVFDAVKSGTHVSKFRRYHDTPKNRQFPTTIKYAKPLSTLGL
jgi:hypothetical protein